MLGFNAQRQRKTCQDLQALGWPALDEARYVQTTKTEDLTPLPEEEQTREMQLWLKYGQPRIAPKPEPFPWHIVVGTLAYVAGVSALVCIASKR